MGEQYMHELAVTTSILNLALQHAEAAHPETAHPPRITDLYLVIGQLSSMIDDSVQFYWDIISQNTTAEGSRLHFRRIPAEFQCKSCLTRYPMRGDDFMCPECGSAEVRIAAGEEFYLEAIDVDEKELTP
jgi:hydrogenase nickel incorporation protein HypA/HybF